MILTKGAAAGTTDKSDIEIILEPASNGVELELKSKVMALYGKQIRKVILQTLQNLEVDNVKVTASDYGALDCVIKARVECAVFRAAGVTEDLPWGRLIK